MKQRPLTRKEFFEAWKIRGFCPLIRADGTVKAVLELKPPEDPSSVGDVAIKDGWYSIADLVESGFIFASDCSPLFVMEW